MICFPFIIPWPSEDNRVQINGFHTIYGAMLPSNWTWIQYELHSWSFPKEWTPVDETNTRLHKFRTLSMIWKHPKTSSRHRQGQVVIESDDPMRQKNQYSNHYRSNGVEFGTPRKRCRPHHFNPPRWFVFPREIRPSRWIMGQIDSEDSTITMKIETSSNLSPKKQIIETSRSLRNDYPLSRIQIPITGS